MINLFEHFNPSTKALYNTLLKAGYTHDTVVIEEDGFLPEGIITPYQFFSNVKVYQNDKGIHFNEIETPDFWEIEGTNTSGTIKDMGELRANIRFRANFKNRIVSHVEWLDKSKQIRFIDYYHQAGFKFATKVFDLRGVPILQTYYDRQGKEVIYENFVTKNIIVSYKAKEYSFVSKVEFVQFFLREAFSQLDGFIINSLSYPFIIVYQMGIKGKDILFWQENIGDDIPGNMKVMFESDMREFTVAIPDALEFNRVQNVVGHDVKHRIIQSGYLYRYFKKAQFGNQVITLTNSDQVEGIELIVQKLPYYEFHIAAVTEMSSKLMDLNKYNNVNLYPNIKRERVIDLYKKSNIYLDINHGDEILESVKGAFDYQTLILGFNEVAHNKECTAPENLYEIKQIDSLIDLLNNFEKNNKLYHERLNLQKQHANEVSGQQFHKAFKK
ncbi:accessory Sec system glycosylation chaperone GtfB [Macrococcus animalis]|uniref:accessory Sec system glycosylation chaperone GtfB n=1 Tax=Macrococcus animalis TaxID=3395467 RepID=UPI0039BDD8C6